MQPSDEKPVMNRPDFSEPYKPCYDYRNMEKAGKYRGVGEAGKIAKIDGQTSIEAMPGKVRIQAVPRDHA